MNPKILFLSIFFTAILVTAATPMAQKPAQPNKSQKFAVSYDNPNKIENFGATEQLSRSYQHQETIVNLDADNLDLPHISR